MKNTISTILGGRLSSQNNLVLDVASANATDFAGANALGKQTSKTKGKKPQNRGSLAVILAGVIGALALLITMICSIVVSEYAVMADWTEGLVAQSLGAETWAGAGTKAEPFEIASELELAQLAVNVNAGVSYKDMYFSLSSTLNLSGKQWTAIGTAANPFSGTFDGKNNSIWYMTGIKPDVAAYGLFGVLGETATVTRVTLFNPIIYGGGDVGSIAGESSGTVSECALLDSYDQYGSYLYENKSLKYLEISNFLMDAGGTNATYSSGTLENKVKNGGTAISGSGNVGGIVGYMNASNSATALILKCLAKSATISSSNNDCGGICGESRANATNTSGSDCRSRIAACLAGDLTVKASTSGSYDAGGIVGFMQAGASNTTTAKSGNSDCFTNLAVNCTITASGNKGSVAGNMSTLNAHGYTRLYDNYSYGCSVTSVYGKKDASGKLYETGNYNTTTVNNVTCTSSSIPSYLSNASSYPQESNPYTWSANWIAITPTQDRGVKNYYTPAPSGLTSYWVTTKSENMTFNINYNLAGGTAGSTRPTTYTYSTSQQTKTLSSPTRSGFTFNGWTASWVDSYAGSTLPSVSGTTLTIRASTYGAFKLTATWTAASYTISYSLGGGTAGSSKPTSYTVSSSSQTKTVSNPTRTNYIFNGWTVSWTNSTYGGTRPSISGTTLTIPANSYGAITLTASWTQNTFYVYARYNTASNTTSYSQGTTGGSVGFSSSCGYSNTSKSTSSSSVYRYASAATGYAFDGWYNSSALSTRVSTSSSYSSSTGSLYAKFSIQQYTATVKPNGGTWNSSTSDQTKTQYYGTTLALGTPTRTGYDFKNWTMTGSGSLSGSTFTFGAGAATITANWTIKSFTVTVKSNNTSQGTVSGGGTINYGSTTTLVATPAEGHKFLGWKLDSNTNYVSTSATYTPTITAACTYTAYFEILTFTVATSIEGAGGTLTGAGTYNWGTTVTVTAAPQNGFYLAGLYVNNEQVTANASYQYSFVIKENKNVRAVFKISNFLTSANSGGEVRISKTDTTATYTAIAYTGYYLNGWFIDGTLYTRNGATVQDRKITLSRDVAYSVTVNAVFGATSTATPSDNFDKTNGFSICSQTGGEVRVNGYSTSDTTVHVSAVFADFGYVFKGWYLYDSDTVLSTEMTCNLYLSDLKGKVLIAKFDVDNTNKNDDTNNTDEVL